VASERQIEVGGVVIGGGAPVVVQSMTLTKTHDVEATTGQIAALASAGCEVRLWARDPAVSTALRATRRHPWALDGVGLDTAVAVDDDLCACLVRAEVAFLAVPSHAMRTTATALPRLGHHCRRAAARCAVRSGRRDRRHETPHADDSAGG